MFRLNIEKEFENTQKAIQIEKETSERIIKEKVEAFDKLVQDFCKKLSRKAEKIRLSVIKKVTALDSKRNKINLQAEKAQELEEEVRAISGKNYEF